MEKEISGEKEMELSERERILYRKLSAQNEVMKLFGFLPADFVPYQSSERPHDYEEKILQWTQEPVEKEGKSRAEIFNNLFTKYSALDDSLPELVKKIADEMRSLV